MGIHRTEVEGKKIEKKGNRMEDRGRNIRCPLHFEKGQGGWKKIRTGENIRSPERIVAPDKESGRRKTRGRAVVTRERRRAREWYCIARDDTSTYRDRTRK